MKEVNLSLYTIMTEEKNLTLHNISIMGSEFYVPCEEHNIGLLQKYEAFINTGMKYEDANKYFEDKQYNDFLTPTLDKIKEIVIKSNLLEQQREYIRKYNEYWKSGLEDKFGNINKEQLAKELSDYLNLMDNASKVYCHVTGDTLSYHTYNADTVIKVADDYFNSEFKQLEKIAHPLYDFEDNNEVFVNTTEGTEFYILSYQDELGAWILIQHTDHTFTNHVLDEDNIPITVFVYEIGWDMLNPIKDYKLKKDNINDK